MNISLLSFEESGWKRIFRFFRQMLGAIFPNFFIFFIVFRFGPKSVQKLASRELLNVFAFNGSIAFNGIQ